MTAILASHNRRNHTLACLASFYSQQIDPAIRLRAVLVDDGSVDGTAEVVRERYPETNVIQGDGTLYWAGAMAIAERIAEERNPDYLLWLNDDVVLDGSALGLLLDIAGAEEDRCIVAGAVRDPISGALTYSGVQRTGFHPLRMRWIQPADLPIEVETFNGNVVLVPRQVRANVGSLDGRLVHAAADFDYGLRARGEGVRSLLAPGTVGICARKGDRAPWLDRSAARRRRLRLLLSPKGLPPAPRARYLKRHGGMAWPVFWVWPYCRAALSLLLPTHRR